MRHIPASIETCCGPSRRSYGPTKCLWLHSPFFCWRCGQQALWMREDAGVDYYHDCSLTCFACGAEECCKGHWSDWPDAPQARPLHVSEGMRGSLIFVDCEADGPCPAKGRLTEFGAVRYPWKEEFYGDLRVFDAPNEVMVYYAFAAWLALVAGRPIFVSDNPAFDWQWINDGFWRTLGQNPFGHSARRLSDFYAGLRGDFWQTQEWKRLRRTAHDHHPVHDALGNLEAFERLLAGER